MIIPDINLLVYAFSPGLPAHAKARRWWQDSLSGDEPVGIPWMVSIGFLRIVTNPRIFTDYAGLDDALDRIAEWYANPVVVQIDPKPEHFQILGRLLRTVGKGADLVNDAHLAALAIEFDGTIYSADKDFALFPSAKWINPLKT